MPAIPKLLTEALAKSRSRLHWQAFGIGLVGGLTLHLLLVATARVPAIAASASGVMLGDEGTWAMLSAGVASLLAALVTGTVAGRASHPHAASNAYLAWAACSLILLLNVALTTDALHP